MEFNVKDYIIDDTFKLTLTEKYIHVYNYGKIIDIDNTRVILNKKNKEIKIHGKDLVINKLDKVEMLITGEFKKVELWLIIWYF